VEIPPYLADSDVWRKAMAGFQGAIRKVDTAVGAILDALRASGLENDTLFVFTTDHGIEMPRAKWFLYDPGIAIGLIVRYPRGGLTGGRTCDLLMSNVDYLPTVFELAHLNVPGRVEGRSFASQLLASSPHPVRESVFAMHHKTQSRCIRTDRYKLIRHFDAPANYRTPVRYEEILMRGGGKRIELYDLIADPNEFHNAADQPELSGAKQRLDGMLWSWMESVNDPLLQGPVRTPSYEAAIQDYAAWKRQRQSQ